MTTSAPDRTATPDVPTSQDPQPAPELVVDLKRVDKTFGSKPILAQVDLQIRRGEFVALLGASGSGKSTLLRILADLEPANGGQIEVSARRSVVFQDARLLPFRRVAANVRLGLRRADLPDDDLAALLAEVGLDGYQRRWPSTLSGGEGQRVALARALAREPRLLLLDEPFAALDALTRIRMHDLVLALWRQHHPGVLFITHDVDEAILLADRVLVLADGGFREDVAITVPRESRRSSWPEGGQVRRQLLAALGVQDGRTDNPDIGRQA
ncbi:ABC transporter ATP-binding protein [Micromonospora zingiberis]|uniref:ABC transporter ATP-binding protein n=1 Tax=Micromonospora zingiberis TaxID=2053011 RepID=A0A4R0GK39_9ACTN|nr:ABC transporter ATP-binding protein [Micromonospora zingiberis]TCB96713.1 ABC transporter ATP-binding protein [Micromonospora zingiberis]